jgi:hypothetical protein
MTVQRLPVSNNPKAQPLPSPERLICAIREVMTAEYSIPSVIADTSHVQKQLISTAQQLVSRGCKLNFEVRSDLMLRFTF